MAGRGAPQWLKDRVGSQFVQSPVDQANGTVPFWWRPEVDTAYRALHAQLAARYDGVAEIREVQISRCTVLYEEPFMRITGDAAALAAFRANGLTRAVDETCLKQQVQAHKVWARTRSVLALNPYQDPATAPKTDVAFTNTMAKQCRNVLGTPLHHREPLDPPGQQRRRREAVHEDGGARPPDGDADQPAGRAR